MPQRVQICTNAKSALYGIIGIEYYNSGYVTDPLVYSVARCLN